MNIVTSLVAVAGRITQSLKLQATVTHEPWTSADTHNKPTYAAGVPRTAVVAKTTRWIRQKDDSVRQAKLHITFLSSVAINIKDRLTLADGTTGPILEAGGPLDDLGNGYVTDVFIG